MEVGAGEWVVKTLRYGYVLPFLRPPPLSARPIEFVSYAVGSDRQLALDMVVEDMLGKEAIELVVDKPEGFYARLFLVPKMTGGWRPVFDLSALRPVHTRKHCLETMFANSLRTVFDNMFANSLETVFKLFANSLQTVSKQCFLSRHQLSSCL